MKKIIGFIILIVSIPVVIINFFYSYKQIKIKTGFINNPKKETLVRVLRNDDSIQNINIEDYLIGVVSSEVPLSFEEEALKAQAVAARTYALKQIENNKNNSYDVTSTTSSQVYKTNNELKELWKDKYEENFNKIKKIVDETKGEYVSYNNSPIYAFFFSTSNGYTENNENVFGQDLPYLKTVDSSFDLKENNNSIVTKEISIEDFYNKLNIEYNENLNISDIIKNNTGRIMSLKINNNLFKGRDFQKKLSLRSNDFEIKQDNNKIIITTKGFGHGVGLSQYGANALAKQKKTYKEILKILLSGYKYRKIIILLYNFF